MLSLRPIRRFCNNAAAIVSTYSSPSVAALNHIQKPKPPLVDKPLEEPALLKLKAERDPEKLFQLFKANAHNRLIIENKFAFEDTVSRLARAGRFDYIEHLLEHQKTLPQGRREGFIVRIIMLYGKAGMRKQAIDTFLDMHLYGCKRSVKSFNAALKILTQSHDLEAIKTFLVEVPQSFDIQLDIFSVNIVIKAFCEMGILDKAYLIMVESEKQGIKPDVITYTTLISAFYKNNRSEIGNGLWNLMVRKGCVPNLATFNVRIQYLVNRRRSWQANDVLRLMQQLRIVPDEVSYNLVIKGFCQAGHLEMAKRVYSAMHRHAGHLEMAKRAYSARHRSGGRRKLPKLPTLPNAKIYQTMIHYLCKGGEFDLAYTMCKDCMKKNWFPNVVTIHTLLEGLKKNKQLEKAEVIMSLARRRVPPFSSNQLSALQSIFSKS